MTSLLDTHFLIWIVTKSRRLRDFPWLGDYRPWGVSPVSLLEIQFLAEVGRLDVRNPEFTDAVMRDTRFTVDEPPLVTVIQKALPLDWTRDPFDRLLVAHSLVRTVRICSMDQTILEKHKLIVPELLR